MQLTKFTDLGLRLVMRLAVLEPGEVLGTADFSHQMSVSYAHAAKVAAELVRLGVVRSERGRHGGLALTESGRPASVGHLARALDGEGEVVECEGDKPCPLRGACQLRGALARAREAFFAELDLLSVAEVSAPPTRRVLLSLAPPR